MKPHIRHAASRFGLSVKRILPVQGVYKVITVNGETYCLKRMPCSEKRLRWIDRSLLMIRRQGITSIVWRRPGTSTGRNLFVRSHKGGPPLILSPWIKGRWPSPARMKDMKTCGIVLAKFHRAGQRTKGFAAGASNGLGKWPAIMYGQRRLLNRCYHKALRNGWGRPMDRLLQAHGGQINRWASEAQLHLQSSGYRSACRSRRYVTLCHGDGGPTNFIFNRSGVHLIDFETLRKDLRAYDLYRMIYNSCKGHRWNPAIAASILTGYQSVTKLTRTDFQLLKAYLRFPQSIYLLLHHYENAGPKRRARLEKQFEATLAAEKRMAAFIRQLNRYAPKISR